MGACRRTEDRRQKAHADAHDLTIIRERKEANEWDREGAAERGWGRRHLHHDSGIRHGAERQKGKLGVPTARGRVQARRGESDRKSSRTSSVSQAVTGIHEGTRPWPPKA